MNKTLTVSDLELVLDYTQTKTARHLSYLKNSGIVNSKKEGQWTFYSIKEEAYDILNQIISYLSKDTTLQNDQEVYETLYSNRELAVNKIEKRKWTD